MNENDDLERQLTKKELKVLSSLKTPAKIQAFLDSIPYSTEPRNRCPLSVLRDRQANCFDGALLGAAALRRLGYPPRIIDLFVENDDDHLLALFKIEGHWGAVAKSNFMGLRFREPVYRTLRELVMSYFEGFFNLFGDKTLRSYTLPIHLEAFDEINWTTNHDALEVIAQRTEEIHRIHLLSDRMIAGLSTVDERYYQAGMLGVEMAGVYKPSRRGRRRP